MIKKFIPLVFLSFLLVGCVSPYQPSGLNGGYTQMALNQDTYLVTFRGNSQTPQGTVQQYALRRAAELTLKRGYKYFIVKKNDTLAHNQIIQTPATIHTQISGGTSNQGFEASNSYTTINPSSEYEIHRFESDITIKMLHDNKDHPDAYDAAIILSNYFPKKV